MGSISSDGVAPVLLNKSTDGSNITDHNVAYRSINQVLDGADNGVQGKESLRKTDEGAMDGRNIRTTDDCATAALDSFISCCYSTTEVVVPCHSQLPIAVIQKERCLLLVKP